MPSPYMEAGTSNNRKLHSAAKVIKELDNPVKKGIFHD